MILFLQTFHEFKLSVLTLKTKQSFLEPSSQILISVWDVNINVDCGESTGRIPYHESSLCYYKIFSVII